MSAGSEKVRQWAMSMRSATKGDYRNITAAESKEEQKICRVLLTELTSRKSFAKAIP